ncbi:MAG: hypothetical protein ACJAWS_001520 [Oleiphilaceae bacterium]
MARGSRHVKEIANKRITDENTGIKLALDVCSNNVMMAGTNFNISYMNRAALQMKSVAESDLRAVLPNFNANNLMGSIKIQR